MLEGGVFDRWTEEKDSYELEEKCLFKVGIVGLKSEQKASNYGGLITEEY